MWFRTALQGLLVLLVLAPMVAAAQSGADSVRYRLGAGDRVLVTVFGHEDLSGKFEVDGSGTISLPLIGDVGAGGRTLRELEDAIVGALKPDFLKNPRVSVTVTNYRPFYILGEVKRPGSYAYVSGMTVVNAVALAGGFTYRAKKTGVLIVRAKDPDKEEALADDNTPVLPGDIIRVPERFF